MPIVVLLILSVVFTSIPTKEIDNELIPYEKEFFDLIHTVCKPGEYINPNKSSIKIVDKLPDPAIGRCFRSPLYAKIEFDKIFWESANENHRFSLVMHEMSHCYLWTDHVEDPWNYMSAYDGPELDKKTVSYQLIQDADKICRKKREIDEFTRKHW